MPRPNLVVQFPAPEYDLEQVSNERQEDIKISVVVPVYDEVENLERLHARLSAALQGLEQTYEMIYIDDGSKDGSYRILKSIQLSDPHVWVIRFRRNFGQTAAFSAGFDLAHGEVVVTIDADLQNDPQDIGLLMEKIDEGYDVVSGWRVRRQDKFWSRRLPSQAANALISWATGVRLHDYGCSLKAYRREVVKNIRLYGEMHRFIPALASWMGIEVAEVPVNHSARQFGRSKYGLGRTVRVLLDLFTVKFLLDYGTRPLQIFGLWGLICAISGTALGLYLSYLRIFQKVPLADRPILLLAILLVMLGVQLITMGLLGEMVVRTYHEAQDKPIYAVRELLSPDVTKKRGV